MPPTNDQSKLTIRFSPKKLLLIFLPIAVLVAISLAINFEAWQRAEAWVYWSFGGIVVGLVFACVVMPSTYFLCLTPEGLRINYVVWHRFYKWDEMRDFRVVTQTVNNVAGSNLVVFDLTEDSPHRSMLTRMAGAINKYDVSIMATFDHTAGQIVDLLHAWKEQYGTANRPAEPAPNAPELMQEPHE